MSSTITDVDNTASTLSERVKLLRKKSGFTLEELSMASGVSRSMLSQIERGQANPTLTVACRIAQAFSISIGELVHEPWTQSGIEVIRADDASHLYRSDDQCRIRTLSPLNMEKSIEFYEISIAPGAALTSAAHFEGTKELFTLNKGSVAIVSEADQCTLKKGDSAHYRADVEHSIRNVGNGRAEGYLVVTYAG
ncbi:helix-turn-helix domain-containing protein [Sedimenticola selenatireducens]|uniref:Helix-turn-helix domain-containing protein n=1 Tax=Sedimenticola selenatireducens TaxID=191960 RepID=A0A557SMQ2_9GAMM|nr:XRE family transcriptional regulator [Sedimenticola selenatireducens]TVO78699.1 helix-turn-helix domain-containing protein [Sedimenticola selenatireducens]TVT62061.1 MAG: helix-turn-helix domain-containing protein [Sedimenticola selenatireducens]